MIFFSKKNKCCFADDIFGGGEKDVDPAGNVQKYIRSHLNYPPEVVRKGVTGKVFVHFTIEKDGRVDNVKVACQVHPLLEVEAVRVISNMPKWKSARKHGMSIRVSYTVSVQFSIEK